MTATNNSPVTDGSVTLKITLGTVLSTATQVDDEGNLIGYRDVTVADQVAEILATRLVADARRDFGRLLRGATSAAEAAAEKLVEEKFRTVLEREIIPTDSYGTPKGPGKTIAEVLDDKVQAWLNAAHGDSYASNRKTNLQKLIDDSIGRQFTGEIQKTVEAAKAEALRAVAEQVTSGITDALKRASR